MFYVSRRPYRRHSDPVRGVQRQRFRPVCCLVTEDFELVDVATGLTLHGPNGLLQWFQGFLTAFPDGRAEQPFNMIAAGDWVASEHIGRNTHTGPLKTPAGEIPPTGRRVDLQIAEVYQMKDGK